MEKFYTVVWKLFVVGFMLLGMLSVASWLVVPAGPGKFVDKPNPNRRYKVVVSNWVGQKTHYCHSYKQDGDRWTLYDDRGGVWMELLVTEGYRVTIKRTQR